MVDIILRILILQEDEGRSRSFFMFLKANKRRTDETKNHQHENSPLLETSISTDPSLSFYHFLHPIMLGVIFCVLAISSVLSAFETVFLISHSIRNGITN